MTTVIGDEMGGMMGDLTENFQRAIDEVLLIAALAATATALLVSSFVTRRIVSPIQEMTQASQRIADGRYDERVHVVSEDELGELASSFNQMAHTLAQTEERRRQLIADVAHELRTPLSSIRSVMEGLTDGLLPAEPATFLSVQNEVSRLQRLVHDLEELSRAEAGRGINTWFTKAPSRCRPNEPGLAELAGKCVAIHANWWRGICKGLG